MRKEMILRIIKELPGEFELEEVFEKLVLAEKIEQGLKQLDDDKTILHNEVKKFLN